MWHELPLLGPVQCHVQHARCTRMPSKPTSGEWNMQSTKPMSYLALRLAVTRPAVGHDERQPPGSGPLAAVAGSVRVAPASSEAAPAAGHFGPRRAAPHPAQRLQVRSRPPPPGSARAPPRGPEIKPRPSSRAAPATEPEMPSGCPSVAAKATAGGQREISVGSSGVHDGAGPEFSGIRL